MLVETVTVRVIDIIRLRNTPSGNARYDIVTNQGTYRTRANSACAYDVPSLRGGRAVLTLTPAGYVCEVRALPRNRADSMAVHPAGKGR